MDQPKCGHDRCHCKGTDVSGDGFCSPACREHQGSAEGRCACGHPDCK